MHFITLPSTVESLGSRRSLKLMIVGVLDLKMKPAVLRSTGQMRCRAFFSKNEGLFLSPVSSVPLGVVVMISRICRLLSSSQRTRLDTWRSSGSIWASQLSLICSMHSSALRWHMLFETEVNSRKPHSPIRTQFNNEVNPLYEFLLCFNTA